MTVVIDYFYKDDCGLCAQMEAALAAYLNELNRDDVDVRRNNIEDNPKWYAYYREYIPVLVIDDEEVCHYFFDEQELTQAIAKARDASRAI